MLTLEHAILPRVNRLVGDRDLGNGTALAAAVVSLLAADAQAKRVTHAQIEALHDRKIEDLADRLHSYFNESRRKFALPFGSSVEGIHGITINGMLLLPDAGRPGLHPEILLRKDAHGPNLDRLFEQLRPQLIGTPYEKLALPEPSCSDDLGLIHFLDFPPLTEAGGAVLRHRVSYDGPFCSLLFREVDQLGERLAYHARKLTEFASDFRSRVLELKAAADRELRRKYGEQSPVKVDCIAYEPDAPVLEDGLTLHVEYRSLGENLKPGRVRQEVLEMEDLHGFRSIDEWDYRHAERTQLELKGARGRISRLAAAIVVAAPEGRAAVLDRLTKVIETGVAISENAWARLYWCSGKVEAHLTIGEGLSGGWDCFFVNQTLPETLMASIVERPINEVIELPFEFRARVTDVARLGEQLRISFEREDYLIDALTDQFRPDSGARTEDASIGS